MSAGRAPAWRRHHLDTISSIVITESDIMDLPQTKIRLVDMEDADALTAHRVRDAEANCRWEPAWPPEFYTVEGQRRRISQRLASYSREEIWPAVVLCGDAVIGEITIQNILLRAWRKGELGYWIATTYQGEGHATRAVELIVRLMTGELGLHRAEAFTQMDNLGSQHVLRNNEFVPFGVARQHIYTAGAWRDEILWERLLDKP
jgi:[ribosomal protein S5]-alanine N-acetyltransferase